MHAKRGSQLRAVSPVRAVRLGHKKTAPTWWSTRWKRNDAAPCGAGR